MDNKYIKTWNEYKEICEKNGRPIGKKEEGFMKPVIESYDAQFQNFLISLLL